MALNNQTIFPQPENDPFNAQVISTEELSPLWSSSAPAPRWQLLTEQEQKDRDTIVRKLESKLKKLDKKRGKSKPNYTNQIIPDVSLHFESDTEQEEGDNRPADEDSEGLPLLWKNRSINLDGIRRKTEDQYNAKQWWSIFTCCCH